MIRTTAPLFEATVWHLLVAALLAATHPASVRAQHAATAGVAIDYRLGVSAAAGLGFVHQSARCMSNVYFVPGLQVDYGRTAYVLGVVEVGGQFGPREDCLLTPRLETIGTGIFVIGDDRLDIESGRQWSVGAGLRGRLWRIRSAAQIRAGVARGQDEFESEWLRIIVAGARIDLSRRFFLAADHRWFRVPYWRSAWAPIPGTPPEIPLNRPGGSETRYRWRSMTAFHIGFRFL